MKDQKEKLVWIALALMVIAFAAGNVSMCLIMHAQRAKAAINVLIPTTAASGYLSIASQIPMRDSIVWFTNQGRIKR